MTAPEPRPCYTLSVDKRIVIPTALVVATAITAETLQPHQKPSPHVETPKIGAPVTPGPLEPTSLGSLRQIS
jgi:hypothetical protein